MYEGAKEFLNSRALTDMTPYEFDLKNADVLLDLIDKNNDTKLKIFRKTSISKYNAALFFFQCLATNMMTIEWESGFAELRRSWDASIPFWQRTNPPARIVG